MTPAVAVKTLQGVRRRYIVLPIFVWFAPHSQVETRKHSKSELNLTLMIDPQLNVLLSLLLGAGTKSHNVNQNSINCKHKMFLYIPRPAQLPAGLIIYSIAFLYLTQFSGANVEPDHGNRRLSVVTSEPKQPVSLSGALCESRPRQLQQGRANEDPSKDESR
jgi:hypothetical protein